MNIPSIDQRNELTDTEPIRIKYIGNSFFYITFPDGTRLVTDPYGPSLEQFFGPIPELEADLITISHNHEDHTYVGSVGGDPLIIRPEQISDHFQAGAVGITSYLSDHVADMGSNIIYIYEWNGIKIVHMGETDSISSPEAVAAVKGADVILAYAGQLGAIRNKESFAALFGLNIRTVIPQHYSNIPDKIFYGEPVIDEILKDVPDGVRVAHTSEFLVTGNLDVLFVHLGTWKD